MESENFDGSLPLEGVDPEMFQLIKDEEQRQMRGIELIASENFTSHAVMECLGSCLTNKYSEGQPGARFYGGSQVVDKIENLCKQRALDVFGLDEKVWGVNVQPYSGSPANFAVYTALLKPHDRIMGLDLPSGGHLTHGFYTAKKRISATSIFFESCPYQVDQKTGWLDFDCLRERAQVFRPKLIIAGISSYPRDMELKRFRQIADEVESLLMCDMAHVSGLVAAGLHSNPFEFCDVVTTTTHKTLRGPRAGIIFYNKQRIPDAKNLIDNAVFPALQGGPHNHQIAAIAVQLKEVSHPNWKIYASQVVDNARTLAEAMEREGFKLVTDGTDNHLLIADLRPIGITGSKFEKLCEEVGISLNKNAIHGDTSAMNPSGVRIGTPAMTSRGCNGEDFCKIARFLWRAVEICIEIQERKGKKLADFVSAFVGHEGIQVLKADVEAFASGFRFPGRLL